MKPETRWITDEDSVLTETEIKSRFLERVSELNFETQLKIIIHYNRNIARKGEVLYSSGIGSINAYLWILYLTDAEFENLVLALTL